MTGNPRGLAFQVAAIERHLGDLPVLSEDGAEEIQQSRAAEVAARLASTRAATMDNDVLRELETGLAELSNAVSRRYFLLGAEPVRAAAWTLA